MNSNNKTLQGLKKVNDRLLGIETFLLALITILLVAAIFIEVVCRYFLFISAAWAEELTRYLFIREAVPNIHVDHLYPAL